jgi:citrate synthase
MLEADEMRLTTEQVAQRLEVKPETVYAYVSRGLLHSTRSADGRGSWFEADEVDKLAARSSRSRGGKDRPPGIRTAITLIKNGKLYYRGREAATLASTRSFEAVATWLWSHELADHATFEAPEEIVELARQASEPLPASTRLSDRIRITTAVAASADPFRFSTQPDAVIATAATLLGAMVDALPPLSGSKADGRLAARLWPKLTAAKPSKAGIKALNAALVLLADHGLATSTYAARVAACSRAHPYAVVAAGLGAFDGPLHGAAPTLAYRLLADAIASGDPMSVYAERLRTEGRVEGFFPGTHPVYPDGDIRAIALMSYMEALPVPSKVRKALEGLIAAAGQRSSYRPNIEFALAVLVHSTQMRPDAGEAIFAIARTAGWIAHALEEHLEPPLRFRTEGSYTGPAPQS